MALLKAQTRFVGDRIPFGARRQPCTAARYARTTLEVAATALALNVAGLIGSGSFFCLLCYACCLPVIAGMVCFDDRCKLACFTMA